MKVRHLIVLLAAVLVLQVAYFWFHSVSLESERFPGYPEFCAVSEADLAQARSVLPESPGRYCTRNGELILHARPAGLDDCSPLAVIATLFERAEKPPTMGFWYQVCFTDGLSDPVPTWLAKQRDETFNEVLCRLAADEEIAFSLRDMAVTALCWEGNREALPELVRLAMDMNACDTIRSRVLFRLPRVGAPPGGEFELLLYLPFRDHDEMAAAVLALTGKPVAPSLILAGLRQYCRLAGDLEHLLVRAAAAVAPDDREITTLSRLALEAVEATRLGGDSKARRAGEDPEATRKQVIESLAAALERWLNNPPSGDDSPSERALDLANRALRLDSESSDGHLVRAQALIRLNPANPTLAIEAAEKAMALCPEDVRAPLVAAKAMFKAVRPEEALVWIGRVPEVEKGKECAIIGRLEDLRRGNLLRGFLSSADAFLEREEDHDRIQLARYWLLVLLGDPRWQNEVSRIAGEAYRRWNITLTTAELLLQPGGEAHVDAQAVLGLLSDLSDLEDEARKLRSGGEVSVIEGNDFTWTISKEVVLGMWKRACSLRGNALEILGRKEEAD